MDVRGSFLAIRSDLLCTRSGSVSKSCICEKLELLVNVILTLDGNLLLWKMHCSHLGALRCSVHACEVNHCDGWMQRFEVFFQPCACSSPKAKFSFLPNKYIGILCQGHFLQKYLEAKCETDALVGKLIFHIIMRPVFFIFQSQSVSIYSITWTVKNKYNIYWAASSTFVAICSRYIKGICASSWYVQVRTTSSSVITQMQGVGNQSATKHFIPSGRYR